MGGYVLIVPHCVLYPEDEKALIARVFNNAIEPLAEEDKTLPQVVVRKLSSALMIFFLSSLLYTCYLNRPSTTKHRIFYLC